MNIAIILAGGIGSRLGADRPKQFIEVLGKPILVYTLEAFQKHADIDYIEVVCVKEWCGYLKKMTEKYKLTKVKWITEGGSTFQQSVINGIYFLKDKISSDDIVLTHFGASPFIESDIITDCIRVCKEKGNAISTMPFLLLSGIKDVGGNSSSIYINRDTIACMNTPHAFRYCLIKELYDKAIKNGDINKVAEPHTTALMQYMGYTVYFSQGSQSNIKITNKEDLKLFEGYIMMNKKYSSDNREK